MQVKYRRLSREELQEMEKEFVDFLVVNGITADDWVKMKEETPEKSERMIDLFSDVVFEGIFRKVKFLDFVSKKELMAFQCLENKMILVGIESEDESINLSDSQLIQSFSRSVPEGIKIYQTEKNYSGTRESELFKMTEKGCSISEGELFKSLSLAYAMSETKR